MISVLWIPIPLDLRRPVRRNGLSGMVKQFIRDSKGSLTLEASLIMPILLLLTLISVFMLLYFYEKSAIYGMASGTAERISYSWDNSSKELESGAYAAGQHDGLYWRLTNDNWMNLTSNRLPEQKLGKAGRFIPESLMSSASYSNLLIHRQVHVEISSVFHSKLLTLLLRKNHVLARSGSGVIEPVEFIRNIRLVQTYWPIVQDKLKNIGKAGSTPTEEDSEIDKEKEKQKKLLEFRYEREARAYLKEKVRGVERDVKLPDGRTRKLDAVDPGGIVHQAYVGYITNRFVVLDNGEKVNGQSDKDGELLKSGQVKAVVWHFYRRTGTDKVGPSKPLLRELERQGIMVVIHDSEYVEVTER
jgi:hypothetical protein